jgi:pentatricopeptide repeat protein
MTACGKAREWKRAVDLLDTMQKDGLEPTVICYNAAVAACGMVGQVRRLLYLVCTYRTHLPFVKQCVIVL